MSACWIINPFFAFHPDDIQRSASNFAVHRFSLFRIEGRRLWIGVYDVVERLWCAMSVNAAINPVSPPLIKRAPIHCNFRPVSFAQRERRISTIDRALYSKFLSVSAFSLYIFPFRSHFSLFFFYSSCPDIYMHITELWNPLLSKLLTKDTFKISVKNAKFPTLYRFIWTKNVFWKIILYFIRFF